MRVCTHIFKWMVGLLQLLGRLILLLALIAVLVGWKLPEGPKFYGVPVFIPGLIIGAAMATFLPYLKQGFQAVSETGCWQDFPNFDARYLALFAIPFLEFGAAFLVTEGLWATACRWTFIHSVLMAYGGADLGKQVGKGVAALAQIAAGAGQRP